MDQVIANPVGALPGIFGVLRNFANSAAVMQPPVNGQAVVDLKRFNFRNYRAQVIRPIRDHDLGQAAWIEVSPFDRLCRNHALRAMHALRQRRLSESGQNANQANTVFANAHELRTWLQTRLGRQAAFVSQGTWMSPWLDMDLADDALATNLNCYASMAALAARASATGWVRYSEFLAWQAGRFGIENSVKATTTLVAMSPELFGFYLLLWELLIRTQPHD
jgi:cellobiose-specific phosphotransferase system component IIA